jgi:ABC-2 type transport system permease protein
VTGPTDAVHPAPQADPPTNQAIWLVAEREVLSRVRSKAFLVSTAILLAVVLGSVIISGVMSDRETTTTVAAVGETVDKVHGLAGIEVENVGSRDEAVRMINDEEVDAAVIADPQSPTGVKIIAAESEPQALVTALRVEPEVELLHPPAIPPGLRYLGALAFGLVFLMSAATFGGTIAQSVVEEKQTRVVEILLSTIPARVLLTGKIIGNALLAFGQVILIGACAVVGLTITGSTDLLGMLGAPMAWFVIFFMIGFVLLASMYAAAASLVSRQEDVQTTVTPVSMLVMIPYFVVIFLNDNDLVVTIMSYVPFSAAVGMPFRIFLGDASWWEPLLSLLILIMTTVAVIGAAARIYRNALLRTGARVPLLEALRNPS